jgi:ribosomal-protein-alanine N-acetyltransferase
VPALVVIDSLAYHRQGRERQISHLVAASPGPTGKVLVVVADGEVRGFLVYQQVLDRATVLDIAVHPGNQGQGLAAVMLQTALDEMRDSGATRCELEVRASNRRAISLYRSFEFVQDGLRTGYYPGESGREDALLMSLELRGADK